MVDGGGGVEGRRADGPTALHSAPLLRVGSISIYRVGESTCTIADKEITASSTRDRSLSRSIPRSQGASSCQRAADQIMDEMMAAAASASFSLPLEAGIFTATACTSHLRLTD